MIPITKSKSSTKYDHHKFKIEKVVEYLFSKGERNIFVFDHVHYLSPHGESEQYHPVEKEYWPKYRHIKYTEECHYKSNAEGFCDRVPSRDKQKELQFNSMAIKRSIKCV